MTPAGVSTSLTSRINGGDSTIHCTSSLLMKENKRVPILRSFGGQT